MPRCVDVADFLERAERVSAEPALLARLRFGRYKSLPMRELPDDYLEWLLKQPNMEADVVFTVRHQIRARRSAALARFMRASAAA